MCYEERSFKLWTKRGTRRREEMSPELEHTSPGATPLRPTPEHETARRKEVEREFEEIV
jgi:hypothetical protein